MTKIIYKEEIYNSIGDFIKRKKLDSYQIRKYCERNKISKYELIEEMKDNSLLMTKFKKEQKLSKLTTTQKERLAYVSLTVGKDIEYRENKYATLLELIREQQTNLNLSEFLNKTYNKKSLTKDKIITLIDACSNWR